MKLRHVGIVISKETFDETIEFYKMFGFVFSHGKVESGEYINNFFHMNGLKILTWKMKNEFDDCIELIRLENDTPYSGQMGNGLRHIGITHIAIQVKNLRETEKKLIKSGVSLVCDIQYIPAGTRSACEVLFCRDPNGVFIELVEEKEEK